MKGTEGLEKIIELVVKAVIIGKHVYADKEVNAEDIKYGNDLFALIKEVYEFVQSKPELAEEIKDIDMLEVVKLIQAGMAEVKKVEEA